VKYKKDLGFLALVGHLSPKFIKGTLRRLISSGGFFMPRLSEMGGGAFLFVPTKLVESLTRATDLLGSPLKAGKTHNQPFDHFSEVVAL
jgi:hypothetical protein